ncbi:MAG: cysteine hydrolase family protein [Bacteroidales bacterium]
MKKILALFLLVMAGFAAKAIPDTSRVALLVIDIQDFYFAGGKSELVDPLPAAENAAKLVKLFRAKGWPVIYVKHQSNEQEGIHGSVKPAEGEMIFTKTSVNSFVGTPLYDYLMGQQISKLAVCGMQTHMCVEAAVRAGADYGFKVTLIHDACATKDLKWGNDVIPARVVHLSTLATLRSYARIVSTEDYLKSIK